MLTGKQLAAYCEKVYRAGCEFEREGYSEEKPVDEIYVINELQISDKIKKLKPIIKCPSNR